jgi:hypothetical protein
MRGRIRNRLVSRVLLVALAPWCAGCATEIHLRQTAGVAGGEGGGRLLVRVFENRSDRKRDVTTHRTIVTELYRVEAKTETLVREEKGPRWSVSELPAGEYLLRAPGWDDDVGGVRTHHRGHHDHVAIRPNETTVADVVLSDPEKAWVRMGIAAVVVVGVGCVMAYQAMQDWHPLAGLSSQ